ncbi:hypothetical protein EV694_1229 [Volucribacter psittacicida]|uniref:Phage abortive infection protein n=1 Tax=Volucribacter psittacicida TaxID=203482 RepID=A0A4R1FY87_9PAST|nr:hypothetical protein [Volucribacter psittacicida]TCJ98802.1 hypothetical protein EV694_1229 [Volucribacter psittacicida]
MKKYIIGAVIISVFLIIIDVLLNIYFPSLSNFITNWVMAIGTVFLVWIAYNTSDSWVKQSKPNVILGIKKEFDDLLSKFIRFDEYVHKEDKYSSFFLKVGEPEDNLRPSIAPEINYVKDMHNKFLLGIENNFNNFLYLLKTHRDYFSKNNEFDNSIFSLAKEFNDFKDIYNKEEIDKKFREYYEKCKDNILYSMRSIPVEIFLLENGYYSETAKNSRFYRYIIKNDKNKLEVINNKAYFVFYNENDEPFNMEVSLCLYKKIIKDYIDKFQEEVDKVISHSI